MGKNLENIKEKTVKIKLDKERELKFGFTAFAILEERFGSLVSAMEALQSEKLSTILVLLWAGLQDSLEEGEVLTEKQLSKMLTMQELPKIMESLSTAINQGLPEEEVASKKKA